MKRLIGIAVVGLLSGCALAPGLDLALLFSHPPEPSEERRNYLEPIILESSENWIQIKYLSAGRDAQHEQVLELIIDHCDGSYIETSRIELHGWSTVEAECNHAAKL